MDPFVHLHAHTEYSALDGHARHKPSFAEAARLGQPALAMTDHGNPFGAYSFWQAAKGTGVKPIIGVEAYMAPSSRYNRSPEFWGQRGGKRDGEANEGGKDVSGAGKYTHMTIWTDGPVGLRNLFALTSRASSEGYYGHPRADLELLQEYSAGLMGTTGCPSGAVQTRLRLGQYDAAVEHAATLRDILGKGNLFVELMDHGLDLERNVRDGLLRVARDLSLPLIATNDSHYVLETEADSHDDLLCVGQGKFKSEEKRLKFAGTDYYLKSSEQMRGLFTELPAACDNTLLVAERVGSYDEVFAPVDRMPRFAVPDGETQESWLRHELEDGFARRFPNGIPDGYRERLDTELGIIVPQGFSAYFLVLADIVRWCRAHDIPTGPGRGSAAGSLVAYLLGITQLDPIEHRLLFERFLNPDRVSPPDIDLDVADTRRGEVVRYILDTYGAEFVSMVNTRQTIKAKRALKDAAKVLEMPYTLGDELSKLLPYPVAGKDVPLACILDGSHKRYKDAEQLRERYHNDPKAKQVIDAAFGIEGRVRGFGQHAAAVIISSVPLLGVVPMRTKDGAVIAGFDYPDCESMGLLKLDLLGIRNLDVIANAVKWIKRTRGIDVDVETLPLDDAKTFQLVGAGRTLGVFQLDGGPIQQLLRAMHAARFEDISATLALYRPGPMGVGAHLKYAKRATGKEPVEPIHPELADVLEPILGETYGLIVYQEQVMAIAQAVAGYSLGQADLLRRAMGKKIREKLDVEKPRFFAGMAERGFSADAAETLWATLEPFADYAFNKSHTAGYGLVAYWTAYLKANYPAEYMAALLTSVGDNRDRMALYLAECRELGIRVLPPDVNTSEHAFTPASDTEVRYGLTAISGVGDKVVGGIIAGRVDGPYSSFADYLTRVDSGNKKTVAALIQAGAFDTMGTPRKALYDAHDRVCTAAGGLRKKRATGQGDLFGGALDAGGIDLNLGTDEWDRRELLAREWEMLGRYVSGHPADTIADALRAHRTVTIAALRAGALPDGATVELAGIITGVERRKARKSGKPYAKVTLEDLDASVEVMVFGETYGVVQRVLERNAAVTIRGRAKVTREDATEDPETGELTEGSIEVSVWVDDVALIDVARAEARQRRRDALANLDPTTPAATVEAPADVAQLPGQVEIRLQAPAVTAAELERLSAILVRHKGDTPVHIMLAGARRATRHDLPRYPVAPSPTLRRDLQAAFGPDCVA